VEAAVDAAAAELTDGAAGVYVVVCDDDTAPAPLGVAAGGTSVFFLW